MHKVKEGPEGLTPGQWVLVRYSQRIVDAIEEIELTEAEPVIQGHGNPFISIILSSKVIAFTCHFRIPIWKAAALIFTVGPVTAVAITSAVPLVP
jgi:hypothetical protein